MDVMFWKSFIFLQELSAAAQVILSSAVKLNVRLLKIDKEGTEEQSFYIRRLVTCHLSLTLDHW